MPVKRIIPPEPTPDVLPISIFMHSQSHNLKKQGLNAFVEVIIVKTYPNCLFIMFFHVYSAVMRLRAILACSTRDTPYWNLLTELSTGRPFFAWSAKTRRRQAAHMQSGRPIYYSRPAAIVFRVDSNVYNSSLSCCPFATAIGLFN
jgi:hypothetical protein